MKPRRHKLDEDDVLRNWIVQKMREGWSPPMISGVLKNRPDQAWMKGKGVSHETIYQYIYEGAGGLWDYTNIWSESTKGGNIDMQERAEKTKVFSI